MPVQQLLVEYEPLFALLTWRTNTIQNEWIWWSIYCSSSCAVSIILARTNLKLGLINRRGISVISSQENKPTANWKTWSPCECVCHVILWCQRCIFHRTTQDIERSQVCVTHLNCEIGCFSWNKLKYLRSTNIRRKILCKDIRSISWIERNYAAAQHLV